MYVTYYNFKLQLCHHDGSPCKRGEGGIIPNGWYICHFFFSSPFFFPFVFIKISTAKRFQDTHHKLQWCYAVDNTALLASIKFLLKLVCWLLLRLCFLFSPSAPLPDLFTDIKGTFTSTFMGSFVRPCRSTTNGKLVFYTCHQNRKVSMNIRGIGK